MTGTKKFHVIRTTLIYLFGYNLEPKSPDPQRLYSIHRRQVVAVQPFSHVRLFATPWTAACQASLSFTMFWSLLKLMSMELVMPPNHLVLYQPLLLLPSIFPSIRVFSNESALCIRWPTYWSFSFSSSPSNEYSGLISFRTDWFDLLAIQGILKSLLQHHSSKESILWYSAFLMVQFSYPYMTIGKTRVLTRWTFVGKVMSLLFNMLSRLVIVFLSRSKCLLISWLQSPTTVILEPPKIKSITVSTVSPSICHEVMGPDAMILAFWMLSFKPTFHSPLLRGSLVLLFCHKGSIICISRVIDISSGNLDSSLCFIQPGISHDVLCK